MATNKNFKKKAKNEILEFLLWLLCRLILWIRSVIEWFENLVKNLTDDLTFYCSFASVLFIGTGFYLVTQNFTVSEPKLTIFIIVSLVVFLGSSVVFLHSFLSFVLSRLGLMDAALKLWEKILEFLFPKD